VLKNALRDFVRELIALVAKRWLLQLGASITGSSALGAAAASAGQNTLAGTALSAAGSWLGNTALGGAALSAVGNVQVGWGMAAAGQTLAAGAPAMQTFGAALYNALPALGIFALAVGGAAVAAGQYARGWNINTPGNRSNQFAGPADPSWFNSQTDRAFRGLGFNDQWAAILSGSSVTARLFGHQARQSTGEGVRGTIDSSGGVKGENWMDWIERGGWFRSDRHGSAAPVAFNAEQQAFFSAVLKGITDVTTTLAQRVGVDRGTALAGYSHDFNLDFKGKSDEEVQSMLSDMFAGVLREQMVSVLDAGGRHGLAEYLRSVTGSAADISHAVDVVLGLVDALSGLDDTIAVLEGGSLTALQQQLHVMDAAVDKARGAFTAALGSGDPEQVLSAEQTLTQAVMARYQAEINMVRELQAAIRAIEDQAYQFAINIAQRINSVGGSRDIGAIAMDRANVLRGRVGSGPLNTQLEDVQGYIGAIDTWYQSRRAAIEKQIQAEIQAQQAINQAQAASWNARAEQLQQELDLARQFQGVLDRSSQMLDDMRLSSANPLALGGRLGLARSDVASLRAAYESATGAEKVTAANKLMDALQTLRGLGQEAYQRPSQEWQDVYNEITSELTAVQGDARTAAERAVDLQQQILEAQQMANSYASMTATASAASNAALDALDKEALGYYEWAEFQGTRLYDLQRQQYQDQLDAITGGMQVELFVAQQTAAAVAELKEIRRLLAASLDGSFTPSSGSGTPAGGDGGGGGSGGGGGGGGGTDTAQVVINVSGELTPEAVIRAVQRAGPTLRRALERT
jgi:hypothetical protein